LSFVADSAQTTGLLYVEIPSASNPILNSNFSVWQRGTSVAVSSANYIFTADRWQFNSSSNNGTVSRQTTNDTTNLPFIQYCARVQRDSGQTAGGTLWFYQPFETINSVAYAGKTVTMSFYARKGANFSAASDVLNFRLYSGTGTDQNFRSGTYTGSATPIDATATLTTTWQRFSATATLASTITEITPAIYYTPSGTAAAADYFEVTGVQIDIGSVALPYRAYGATYQQELAACQRYYVRFGGNTADEIIGTIGTAYATTAAAIAVPLPVRMRIIPASVEFSTLGINDVANAIIAVTALTLSGTASPSVGALTATVASGATQYRPYRLQTNNSTSGYVGFSAEL
jgi:hypothetical protein